MSGQGDDGFFQEREAFGLTALEALSAEESQVINRNKGRRLLSCCQDEDEDKILDFFKKGNDLV